MLVVHYSFVQNYFDPKVANLGECCGKFFRGITNLVGVSPFSFIVLWSLIISFGYGIARVENNFPTNISS